jgi:DNA mismatch endonuclease, patch repair protein
MADVVSPARRSEIMSRIRRKGTKPERLVEAALEARGLRFKQQYGRAHVDIAFPKAKVAVFVDGCFWHGCSQHRRRPDSNSSYWDWKLRYNRSRDSRVRRTLRDEGWLVIRVWEHSLPKLANRFAALVERKVLSRT